MGKVCMGAIDVDAIDVDNELALWLGILFCPLGIYTFSPSRSPFILDPASSPTKVYLLPCCAFASWPLYKASSGPSKMVSFVTPPSPFLTELGKHRQNPLPLTHPLFLERWTEWNKKTSNFYTQLCYCLQSTIPITFHHHNHAFAATVRTCNRKLPHRLLVLLPSTLGPILQATRPAITPVHHSGI
jgi:hypothetical protein